jgi:hypothetical protein
MRRYLVISVVSALVFALTSPAMAWSPRLEVDENNWIQFGFLAQLQYEAVEDAAGVANDKWSNEFFTRRARILAQGAVHEKVQFFFDTDLPNAGKTGAANTLIWNDGIIDLQFAPALKVSLGRILPPFSLESQASAASLLGIDYNLNTIKLPTPNERSAWRDDGIEARGILAGGLIDYRAGVFRGERDAIRNPDQDGRFTGMVMLNFGAAQPGWFYNMNSLGSLQMLSIGAGYDRIGNSAAGLDDGEAWSVFALVDQPLGVGAVTVAAAWYDWDGPNYGGFVGNTASAQVGFLFPCRMIEGARIQPVVRWQYQDPDEGLSLDTFNLGLNYFLKGHNINFKADYAINDRRIGGEKVDAVRFQTQLLF